MARPPQARGQTREHGLGAIINSRLFLEQPGVVDTVILDKTGTLTYGEPRVHSLVPTNGVGETALADTAAAAELRLPNRARQ